MRVGRHLAAALGAIVVLSCVVALGAPDRDPTPLFPRCETDLRLPDRDCQPGVVGGPLRVCHERTGRVRPPLAYTEALKRRQIRQYNYSDRDPAHYEEDHVVPLALGGHPTDPRNLWPEPRYGPFPAAAKDALEFAAFKRVCDGGADLREAQRTFMGDYTWPALTVERGER